MNAILRAAGAVGLVWFVACAGTSLDAALSYPDSIEPCTLPSVLPSTEVTRGDAFYHGALISLDFVW